jgi:hypothetical protein
MTEHIESLVERPAVAGVDAGEALLVAMAWLKALIPLNVAEYTRPCQTR